MIKSVEVWRRPPTLDDFFHKISNEYKYDTGRILKAYNFLSNSVQTCNFDYCFDEYYFFVNDIDLDIWKTELKPLMIEEGFSREVEYLEKYIGNIDENFFIIRTDSIRPRVYLSTNSRINPVFIMKLIQQNIVKYSIEFNIHEFFPSQIRFLIRVNRGNIKLFRNYNIKHNDIIVLTLTLTV